MVGRVCAGTYLLGTFTDDDAVTSSTVSYTESGTHDDHDRTATTSSLSLSFGGLSADLSTGDL